MFAIVSPIGILEHLQLACPIEFFFTFLVYDGLSRGADAKSPLWTWLIRTVWAGTLGKVVGWISLRRVSLRRVSALLERRRRLAKLVSAKAAIVEVGEGTGGGPLAAGLAGRDVARLKAEWRGALVPRLLLIAGSVPRARLWALVPWLLLLRRRRRPLIPRLLLLLRRKALVPGLRRRRTGWATWPVPGRGLRRRHPRSVGRTRLKLRLRDDRLRCNDGGRRARRVARR